MQDITTQEPTSEKNEVKKNYANKWQNIKNIHKKNDSTEIEKPPESNRLHYKFSELSLYSPTNEMLKNPVDTQKIDQPEIIQPVDPESGKKSCCCNIF